jgi:hypothetical protein
MMHYKPDAQQLYIHYRLIKHREQAVSAVRVKSFLVSQCVLHRKHGLSPPSVGSCQPINCNFILVLTTLYVAETFPWLLLIKLHSYTQAYLLVFTCIYILYDKYRNMEHIKIPFNFTFCFN